MRCGLIVGQVACLNKHTYNLSHCTAYMSAYSYLVVALLLFCDHIISHHL